MKYAITFTVTLLLSLTAFSRTGTDTSKLILSQRVGKQVALDLVSYDSVKSVLSVTQAHLSAVETRSRLQDTVIKTDSVDIAAYKKQIDLYESKTKEYDKQVAKLQRSVMVEKTKGKITLYTGIGVFIAGSIYIMTHK
mgnify:CR=1 FL=1